MKLLLKPCLLLLMLFPMQNLCAQTYVPGQSYFGHMEYVEYIHGNLPIILSAPHGGDKRPSDIPDRDCAGCVTLNDTNTQELSREIAAKINELTGCYPAIIINRLHRSKLDANREIIEAADGNSDAELAWQDYQDFIAIADSTVVKDFQKGIFLDMHGHAHNIQRLELGYLLSKNNLQLDDVDLNETSLIEKSSIRNLANDNLQMLDFSELIRSDQSFGSLIDAKGYPAVPSASDPYPEDSESYFTGGYNTVQNGSRNEGAIDAIQIECNQDVRFIASDRLAFADSLAQVILDFLDLHYFQNDEIKNCGVLSNTIDQNLEFAVFPNPTEGQLFIQSDNEVISFRIFDSYGRTVLKNQNYIPNTSINLNSFNTGVYIIRVTSDAQAYSIKIYLRN